MTERRDHGDGSGSGNGNGSLLQGAPWYVRIIPTLGITTVLTIFFVFWLTQSLDKRVDALMRDTAQISSEMTPAHDSIKALITAHIEANAQVLAELLYYQRQQCIIMARIARMDAEQFCVPRYLVNTDRQPQSGQPPGRMFDR